MRVRNLSGICYELNKNTYFFPISVRKQVHLRTLWVGCLVMGVILLLWCLMVQGSSSHWYSICRASKICTTQPVCHLDPVTSGKKQLPDLNQHVAHLLSASIGKNRNCCLDLRLPPLCKLLLGAVDRRYSTGRMPLASSSFLRDSSQCVNCLDSKNIWNSRS